MNKKIVSVILCTAVISSSLVRAETCVSKNGYTVDFPDTCKHLVIDCFILPHQKDQKTSNINILVQPLPVTIKNLEDYTELSKKQYEQFNAKILEVSDVEMGSLPAKKLVVEAGTLKYLQVYVVKEGKAYLFTYSANITEYEKDLAEVEKILASWKFE